MLDFCPHNIHHTDMTAATALHSGQGSMRNLYQPIFLLVGIFLLTGEAARATGDVNTSYVISNQQQLGITRAFDDGQNTVIVFADVESQKPLLVDRSGKSISAERVGDYLVLPGLFDEVHIQVGAQQGVLKLANLPGNESLTTATSSSSAARSETPPPSSAAAVSESSAYKPGSAVYPIPFAKGAPPKTIGETSGTSILAGTRKDSATAQPASTASSGGPSAVHPSLRPVVPSSPWKLKQGYPIGEQLKAWGQQAHWDVVWNYPTDIVAPADYTAPSSDFEAAAEDVINTLAANGALIHYRAFLGNNTFLVFGTGAATP